MSHRRLRGRVWHFGDDINTDLIIPARYLNTYDPAELAAHCMEDANPAFAQKVKRGDIIVAGKNFGCGSSREHAPIALRAAGVACVVAPSFARIFFRNAINVGLAIVESSDPIEEIQGGDEIEIDFDAGQIIQLSTGRTFRSTRFPEFMEEIIAAGGLMNWISARGKV